MNGQILLPILNKNKAAHSLVIKGFGMFTTVGNFIGDKFACYSAHFVIGKLMEKSLIIERYWLF